MTLPHYSRNRRLSDGKYYQSYDGYSQHPAHDPAVSASSYVSRYYTSKLATMSDCINPYSSRGYRSPGPCDSLKISRLDSPSISWSDADPGGYTDYFNQYDPNHYDLEQIASYLPHVPSSIVQDNRIAAVMKSITQVPTDISVINFAFELLEWQKAFEHYRTGVTKGGLRMKDIPGWANSTILDYAFNLSPFVGDIAKMFDVYDRVVMRLDFLRKTRGKLTKQSFFNATLWDNNPWVGQEVNRSYASGPFLGPFAQPDPLHTFYMGRNSMTGDYGYVSLEVDQYAAHFSSSWYLLQELDGLDDAWATLRGLIAGLGINNPAKIVWNAIPFSFVADWAFPFGSLLDRLAVQPFAGRWEIYDMVNSVKESWHLKQRRVYQQNYSGIKKATNRVLVERYSRRLGANIALEDIDLTDLDQKQQLLLGSLLAGNTLFRNGPKPPKKHK